MDSISGEMLILSWLMLEYSMFSSDTPSSCDAESTFVWKVQVSVHQLPLRVRSPCYHGILNAGCQQHLLPLLCAHQLLQLLNNMLK